MNRKPATALRSDVRKSEAKLRGEIRATAGTLRGEIRETESKLRAELHETETKLRGEIQAAREEARAADRRLAIEIVTIKETMATKADMAAVNARISEMTGVLSRSVAQTADLQRTMLVFDQIIGQHGGRLDSHDARIRAVESRQA